MPHPSYYELPGAVHIRSDTIDGVTYVPMASQTDCLQKLCNPSDVMATYHGWFAEQFIVDGILNMRDLVQCAITRGYHVTFMGEYICDLSYVCCMPSDERCLGWLALPVSDCVISCNILTPSTISLLVYDLLWVCLPLQIADRRWAGGVNPPRPFGCLSEGFGAPICAVRSVALLYMLEHHRNVVDAGTIGIYVYMYVSL